MTCSQCSTPIPIDAKFCPVCGTRVDDPGPSKTIAMGAVAPTPVAPVAKPAKPDAVAMDMATQLDGPRAIAGRFLAGKEEASPVGSLLVATDLQNGGASVHILLVDKQVLPTAAVVDRALREWKQLSKVTTPRIAHVVDQGKLDDGQVYVATTPPRGVPLNQVVAMEGTLSIERVRSIVTQVGEALAEAQKVGVIHRDVAPRNIFVDGENVTLNDFGVGEAVNDKVFGTPAFLSPEQAEGKPVDQRSNIYSLGAVIYYMLTGRPPFDGDANSLLAQHVSSTPSPPSTHRAGLPAELDRIVMKALEKSGGRRHLTLRQLVTEVEAVSPSMSTVRKEALGIAPTVQSDDQKTGGAATVLGMSAPSLAALQAAVAQPSSQKTVAAEAPVIAPTPVVAPAPVVAASPVASASTVMAPAPAPVVAKPVAAAAAAKPAPAKSAAPGKGFRETAWFKAGELEEEMAKASAAASAASGADPLAPSGTTGTHGAVDASKVDVDAQDRQRLSLKTGATQMMQAVKAGSGSAAIPGDRMDESEMIAELDGGKRARMVVIAIAVTAVAGIGLYFALHKAEPDMKPAPPAPAPKAAVEPAKPVAPTPPPPPAPPTSASMMAEAAAEISKQSYVLAVDALLRASAAGADATQVGALAATIEKAVSDKAIAAHKKKDRAGETEAKALLAKVKPLVPAHPAGKKHPVAARHR